MGAALGAAVEHAEGPGLDMRPEAEHAEVGFHQHLGRAGAQMDVADEGILRHLRLDMAGIAEVAQRARHVQRLQPGMPAAVDRDQRHAAVRRDFAAQPALRRVEAYLDAVAVGDIERFRNQVILGAVSQPRCLEAGGCMRELAALCDVDGDMEEIARLLRQSDLGPGMKHDQRSPAGAKSRHDGILAKQRQPKGVAPDIQGRRYIGHPEMDRPETGQWRQQSFIHRRLSDCGQ